MCPLSACALSLPPAKNLENEIESVWTYAHCDYRICVDQHVLWWDWYCNFYKFFVVVLFLEFSVVNPFTATGYFDIPPPRWPTFLAMLFPVLLPILRHFCCRTKTSTFQLTVNARLAIAFVEGLSVRMYEHRCEWNIASQLSGEIPSRSAVSERR